jgi:anti-sigma factor RsiW
VNCVDAGRLLDPYLDGELAEEQAQAVRLHIATCTACTERLAAREGLSRLIHGIAYAPAPERLRRDVLTAARRRQLRGQYLALAATIVLAGAIGVGLLILRGLGGGNYAETAVAAHVRSLGPGPLVEVVSTDRHTVKPWFQGRLDFAPPVEDTAAAGFPLVGGRIDRLGSAQAAALVYQRRLHMITVFVQPTSARDDQPAARTIRGFEVRRWNKRGMSFCVVSDVNGAELDLFVKTLRTASP